MLTTALILALVFLLGGFFLQATNSAFQTLEASRSREQLRETEVFFLYRALLRRVLPRHEIERLFFSISCTKHICRFGYAVYSAIFIAEMPIVGFGVRLTWLILGFLIALLLSLILSDSLPRKWGATAPSITLRISAPIASLYLLVGVPITYLLLLFSGRWLSRHYVDVVQAPVEEVKGKIMEMIQEAGAHSQIDQSEKRLLEGVAGFRERIVREVMMPRVDIEALPDTATIREAASLFDQERYSRIPVYQGDIDHIVGLLMVKDVMGLYVRCVETGEFGPLDQRVDQLVKPVVYVPESSAVTHLLHELRAKQTHLAVVVDEYGGTEGIVTLEDCIEEIVGEISDETDVEEERLYRPHKQGGWVVDARMTIHDIHEAFGVEIPQEGEYDTIGGYAFHCAGEIPTKGLQIHHDDFDLEILEASERHVISVKITPREEEGSSEPSAN